MRRKGTEKDGLFAPVFYGIVPQIIFTGSEIGLQTQARARDRIDGSHSLKFLNETFDLFFTVIEVRGDT